MTKHNVYCADARDLSFIPDASVHLVLTSPPYWNLKEYERDENQLGLIEDYDEFIGELERVFRECYPVGAWFAWRVTFVSRDGNTADTPSCPCTRISYLFAAESALTI